MRSNRVSLKALACLLIFCIVCGLSCRRRTPQADVNKPAPAPKETRPEADVPGAEAGSDDVAVIVNGVEITEDEMNQRIEPQLAALARQAQDRPPEYMEQMRKMFREQVLERLIFEQLVEERARQDNIVVTDEELADQIAEIASAQRPPMTVEEFKEKLKELGEDYDAVKQEIRKGVAFQKLMDAQLAGRIDITVEDANQYYQKNRQRFNEPEQARASHILIKPADTADPNADPNEAGAKAKAKAEELLEQIKAGSDFAELAKANSDCPSAENGGDLGFFSRGRMVPPFETAAFALEVGQVSDIVETRFGYHIIKVTDHKDAVHKTFEQVKDEIMQQLMQIKQRELVGQFLESLRAQADIVYSPGKEPTPRMPRPVPVPEEPVEPEGDVSAEE
jgi:peptidyl-prolyl cis-trans isomerase C